MALTPQQLRQSHDVRKMIQRFTKKCYELQTPCYLCRQPIDYTIEDIYDDGHFEVDHLYSISEFPEYAADEGVARASHRACNRKKGGTREFTVLDRTSIDWENL